MQHVTNAVTFASIAVPMLKVAATAELFLPPQWSAVCGFRGEVCAATPGKRQKAHMANLQLHA
jgi:hypothetical protein